jgi:hypothetical protein
MKKIFLFGLKETKPNKEREKKFSIWRKKKGKKITFGLKKKAKPNKSK